MEISNGYNTKNRNEILNYLQCNLHIPVSIQNVLNYLEKENISINRTTIYRYLNKLCEDNVVIKYVDNNVKKTVYQYVGDSKHCHNHLHLKCVVCNKVMHLDCTFMEEIKKHLYLDHNFNLQCEGSILYGVCEDCKKKVLEK